jgi:hypothetical protein
MAQKTSLRAASLVTFDAPELEIHRSVERACRALRAGRSPGRKVSRMP